ncbi:MAG TPA: signal peptidase I [Candidatus Pacearchaeota archaeon]|nr:signal peptidase I [Candidatus Pacearchaeota archaeon]
MNLKEGWKKFWNLLWKEDSLKGWLFSVIFLFIFIKLIFFPVLGLATGTALPLAIVESCSMYHDGNLLANLDSWWENHEEKYSDLTINKLDFEGFPIKNGFNKGDILLIVKAKPEKLEEGDVIIFSTNQKNPVIHRIVDIKEIDGKRVFSTIGDNNEGQLSFEKEISEEQLVGKALVKLAPYFGWVKLVFFEWKKPLSERGFCNER